jgi:hypothetical protein
MKVNNLRALDEFNKYACSQCKNRRAKWEGATMQANFGASKAAGRRAAGLAVAAVASGASTLCASERASRSKRIRQVGSLLKANLGFSDTCPLTPRCHPIHCRFVANGQRVGREPQLAVTSPRAPNLGSSTILPPLSAHRFVLDPTVINMHSASRRRYE